MTSEQLREAWHWGADRYRRLAVNRADEGTSIQLACLVLAEYCAHRWSGNYGGPTLEMVALAESIAEERLDQVVGPELVKVRS
jgi:hypothetical protein